MIEKLLLRALEKKCKGCNSIEIELNLLEHEVKLSFEKSNGQLEVLNNHIDKLCELMNRDFTYWKVKQK